MNMEKSIIRKKRTIRKKRWLCGVLAAGILLMQTAGGYAAETELPSGISYERTRTDIQDFVSDHEETTAGMMVSVFQKNKTIYSDHFGYADKENLIPITDDTVMEWGSATKMLVWVSVMQLWEQGKIDLEADVRHYLPEDFLTNLRYEEPVTMVHLMNHNAGFQETYADLFVKDPEAVLPLGEALQAHEPEQIYAPGSVTAYSNWGVALAGYIVEQVSGQSFDEYVHKHIFQPLGMEHSALRADLSDDPWVREQRTKLQCYEADGTLMPDCFYYITLYPAGMCTSTLSDFEAFGKALLDPGSPLFRQEATWKELFTPTAYLGDSRVPSNYHGFWVEAYGVETVGHGGNTAGCSSYLLLDHESGTGAVVMTNQSNETVYNSEMMELIFGKYDVEKYFPEGRAVPEGIFRPARTVRKGPFKVMSLSFLSGDEMEADEFWATASGTAGTSEREVKQICFPYADYVRVPMWQFVLEMASFILAIVAAVFAVLSLLVKLVRRIVCAVRRRQCVIPMGRWSTLASVSQLLFLLLFAVMAYMAFTYETASSYLWVSGAMGIVAAGMAGMVIYGILKLRRTDSTKKRKAYNVLTALLLAVTVCNICYWNLFQFWKI